MSKGKKLPIWKKSPNWKNRKNFLIFSVTWRFLTRDVKWWFTNMRVTFKVIFDDFHFDDFFQFIVFQARIVYYLMNVHITPRTIYLCRHGESLNNVVGRLGGDSKLTRRGNEFAKQLGDYVNKLEHKNFKVWTSWLVRTIETADYIEFDQER